MPRKPFEKKKPLASGIRPWTGANSPFATPAPRRYTQATAPFQPWVTQIPRSNLTIVTLVTVSTHKLIQPVIQPLCDDGPVAVPQGPCCLFNPTRPTFGCVLRRRSVLSRIRLFLIPVFLMLFGVSDQVRAQYPWSGLIAPNRAIDWSQAGAGAIPSRTTICTTLNSSAPPTAVASALAACPSGQTVMLAAGTYNWSSSLIVKI